MKHKKILALSLAAAMSFSLCGCAVELNLGAGKFKWPGIHFKRRPLDHVCE